MKSICPSFLVIICCIFVFTEGELTCDVVYKGDYYANGQTLNFWGFKSTTYMEREIILNPNTAQYPHFILVFYYIFGSLLYSFIYHKYLFAKNDTKGHQCGSSWNKLWGSSRCGSLNQHHSDSDRFVFRRHIDCLIFNGSYLSGEVENCSKSDQIEIAAYAYDLSHAPISNSSLLSVFTNSLTVNTSYTLGMNFTKTSTIYTLMSSPKTGKTKIETQTIQHTECAEYKEGYILGLYFGGECPAPQEVGICYGDIIGPNGPTINPTDGPTFGPSDQPTNGPTSGPTDLPTVASSATPVMFSFSSLLLCLFVSVYYY